MADQKITDRKDRLSAALRENLKRRKQQLRGRAGPRAEGGEREQPDRPAGQGGDAARDEPRR